MIIVRTPVRISLFGGGSDHMDWLKEYPGAVVNTTIDKYIYLMVRYLPPFFNYKYRLRYRLCEEINSIEQIKHPAIRECLKYMNENRGIELVHSSDIPARSGVGSSSSFVVSLLHSLNALQGKMITQKKLASDAIYLEQDIIKENVGSQDQIAAAYGGFNRINFYNDKFDVQKITIPEERKKRLENNLMMFFTGFSRTSSEIANKYIHTLRKNNKKELKKTYELVNDAIDILNSDNIDEIGFLLHEAWNIKKSISNIISNRKIDDIYMKAIKAGALGGKLCGAGSGGIIIFYCTQENQDKVKKALSNLLYIPFKFEHNGSQVISYHV